MATKIVDFHKSRLTVGAHHQFNSTIYTLTLAAQEALNLTELNTTYKALIDQEQTIVNRQLGSAVTEEMVEADRARDNAIGTLFRIIDAYTDMPDTATLAAAKRLATIIKPYRGIGKHEMMKQTTEVTGLMKALGTEEAIDDLDLLNLGAISQKVKLLNNTFKNLTEKRDEDTATRAPISETDTRTLRRQIDDIYTQITDHVYAMAIVGTAAQKEAAEALIVQINVRVEHYKDIIARAGGKTKEEGGEVEDLQEDN